MAVSVEHIKEIAGVVDVLRSRIDQHRQHIAGHETRTRIILIDPLLRVLGWHTEEPTQVVHEYAVGKLKEDYALVNSGTPVAIVEAKRLGTKLATVGPGKLAVAINDHIQLVVLTDGDRWDAYRAPDWKRVPIIITKGPTTDVALDLAEAFDLKPPLPPLPPPPQPDCIPINDRSFDPLGKKLAAFRSYDGKVHEETVWARVLVRIAKQLATDGLLRTSECPYSLPKATVKYLVHSSPAHRRGKPFESARVIGDRLFLELWQGSVRGQLNAAARLLELCGKDPSTVCVKLADTTPPA